MKFLRSVAVTVVLMLVAVLPATALAGSSTSTTRDSQLSTAPPSRLSASTGDLPHTGLNLLPETLAGIVLVGAGIALRARRG